MTLEEVREAYLTGVCELCHYPYAAESQEALEDLCAACPAEAALASLIRLARTDGAAECLRIVKEEMLRGGDDTCM